MITDADLHFHNGDSPAFDHAETLFLIFSAPEARISGNAYVSFQSLYRWTMGNRVGFSNVTDVIGVTTLSNRLSRLANRGVA